MKLSEYITKLEVMLAKHGDVNVIYSSDPEGNNFGEVYYDPSPCQFEKDDPEGIEFLSNNKKIKVNAVCIN